MLTKNVLKCTGTWHSRRAIVCNQSTALSTRMRFHLRTQLFVNGYGFRPHVPDENDRRKRNFSKTLSRLELFENAVFACTCGQTKTELFENAEDTLSVSIDSAQKLTQHGGRALSFLVFYTWAYFSPNCLFSRKFSFFNSSS